MNLQKLLACTLALVLIAGISSPAFGESSKLSELSESVQEGVSGNILEISEVPNVIFDGGAPDLIDANEMTSWVQAEDFVLTEDDVLTDIHFWTAELGEWDGTIEWFLFVDDGGQPAAAPFAQGNGISIDRTDTGGLVAGFAPEFEYWMDFDVPVPLEGGTTYWLGLHFGGSSIFWETTSSGFGSTGYESFGGTFDNWSNNGNNHAFFLTGKETVVGGEFLPINTAALLVAGAQTNAVWILTALAGIASAAFGTLYLTTKKN